MRADLETSSRCAMAALDALSREIDRLQLSAEQGQRLGALTRMTREHVAEIADVESQVSELAEPRRKAPPGGQGFSHPGSRLPFAAFAQGSLEVQAASAWAAVTALRGAPTVAEAQQCRDRLREIHSATSSASVRRLCEFALGPRLLAVQ